jgi:hypothetical protein
MILHKGERVFWGTAEVIYLEGAIIALDEQSQTVVVHIDRTTPHSAHLIDTDVPFTADGVRPVQGASPPNTTTVRSAVRLPPPQLTDEEKILRAAAAAVHQKYGYELPAEQEQQLIQQVSQVINNDPTIRSHVISSMDEILRREL